MSRVIAITGGSSGLGRALALEYAASGVTLALIGRDAARLEATASEARARGAEVRVGTIDVRDRSAMSGFLLAIDAATPIDCLIASAGVSMVTPAVGAVEDLTKSADLFDVNLNGVMNALAPVAPRMRQRRSGQIALFGSIAAFAPPPNSPSYAASKAAIVAFGLATRALYHADGVSVSVVCPGFVDTPMTGSYEQREAVSRQRRRGRPTHPPRTRTPKGDHRVSLATLLRRPPSAISAGSLRRRAMLSFRASARPPV